MSKSSGEFLTLPLLVSKGYDPLDYRLFCLGAHYRSQLQFSYQAMDSAKASRKVLMEKVGQLRLACSGKELPQINGSETGWIHEFDESIAADMNMPKAMAALWGLLKDDSMSAEEKLAGVLYMDQVLGLKLDTAVCEADSDLDVPQEVLDLVEKRAMAKKSKDWVAADKARDMIEQMGFAVKDTPQGAKLVKKV